MLVAHLSNDKGWQRNGCLALACSRFKMEDHIKSALVSIHTRDGEPNAKTVGLVTWAPLGDMSQSRPISIFEQSYRGKRRSMTKWVKVSCGICLFSLCMQMPGVPRFGQIRVTFVKRVYGIGKTGSLELSCASKMCHWSQCGSSMAAVSSFCAKERCAKSEKNGVKRVTDERWWKERKERQYRGALPAQLDDSCQENPEVVRLELRGGIEAGLQV